MVTAPVLAYYHEGNGVHMKSPIAWVGIKITPPYISMLVIATQLQSLTLVVEIVMRTDSHIKLSTVGRERFKQYVSSDK